MHNGKKSISGILAACVMLVIILDGKTALYSMQGGLQLCIWTVIPALFPFFVLSGIINSSLLGQTIGVFRYLGKLCKVPCGSESILVVGFLSGYPVGAQLVAQAYRDGKLSANTAKRMLGFCSNAGPAFLFGMLSPLFHEPYIPWILWGIHIAGALFAGWALPGSKEDVCVIEASEPITLPKSLQNALKCMASVCGWVIVFRLLLGFCDRWFLWLLPTEGQVLFTGTLELSNGCIMLNNLPLEGMRFILASILLSFGGVCVGMQTLSFTQGLGLGYYLQGKILQGLIGAFLSCILQSVILPQAETISIPTLTYIILGGTIALILYLLHRKKL